MKCGGWWLAEWGGGGGVEGFDGPSFLWSGGGGGVVEEGPNGLDQ